MPSRPVVGSNRIQVLPLLFSFTPDIWRQISVLSTRLPKHLRHCTPPSHTGLISPHQCISRRAHVARWNIVNDVTWQKQTENGMGVKACWCLVFVAAPDALSTQNVSVWRPGNEMQESTIFLVRSRTARTNPTDSTFEFKSLWIILTWCEVLLTLHWHGL